MSTALSPDGKYLLVLNGGYRPPSVSVIDTALAQVTGSVPVADGWLGPRHFAQRRHGLCRRRLQAFALRIHVRQRRLTPARTFVVVPQAQRGTQDFIGDVALLAGRPPALRREPVSRRISVVNPQSGMVIGQYQDRTPSLPHSFHPDGKSFFVTHWADGTMGQYDPPAAA